MRAAGVSFHRLLPLLLGLVLAIMLVTEVSAQTRPATPSPSPTILPTTSPVVTAKRSAQPTPAATPQVTVTNGPTQAIPVTDSGLSEMARRYLTRDLDASTFEELAARLRLLKLSDQGTRDELRTRLIEHYGIKATPSPTPAVPAASGSPPAAQADSTGKSPADSAMVVTIESASAAKYMTIEEVNENYMRLSGGVILSITDSKTGTVHHISADEIMYNKQKDVMTARGNVEYKLVEGTKIQTFTGNEMDFSLPNSDGIFLNGTMTKDQAVKGNTLTFVIKGTKISRNDHNLVVMDDASLTSSKADPPNYHIDAKKIWILQPGEWALNDATLYIGRVPVFYLPFFFYPGDEVIIHPVAGYKTIEGAFLQTTTYLLGKKPAASSSISFMQIDSGGPGGDYDNRIHGFFMEKIPKKGPVDPHFSPSQYIKVLVDIYSTLGYFAAVQGDIKSEKVPQLTFLAGIGFSKAIFATTGLNYTSYYNGGAEYWDQGYLGGISLPFRFLLDLRTQIKLDTFNLTLTLPLASDPYMRRDFMTNRAEDIDWGKLIGITKDTTTTTTTTTASSTDTMNMGLSTDLTLSTPELGQWIQSIRLSRLNLGLVWNSRLWKNPPAQVTAAYQDANTNFYAPDTLTLPDMAISVSGTLLQYPAFTPAVAKTDPALKPATTPTPPPELKGLMAPWATPPAEDPKSPPVEKSAEGELRVPYRPPLPGGSSSVGGFTFNIGYSFDPGLSLVSRFAGTRATDPSQISSAFDYQTFKYNFTGKLLYSMALPLNYLTFNGEVDIDKRESALLLKPDPTNSLITDASNIYQDAAAYRSYKISDTNTLTVYPLKEVTGFSNSSLAYGIVFYPYQYSNTGIDSANNGTYSEQWLAWNSTMVTSHYASATLDLAFSPVAFNFTSRFNLPPVTKSIDLSSTLSIWMATLSGSEKITLADTDSGTVCGPITLALNLPFTTWLSSTSNASFDPMNTKVVSLDTTLKFFGLTGTISALQSQPEFFALTGSTRGWNKYGNTELLLKTTTLGYVLDWTSDPFWFNRITTGLNASLSWTQDYIEVTNSTLSYSLSWKLGIFEFMDFTITVGGGNTRMYRYFPAFNRIVGLPASLDRNIFQDLLRSFNFFQSDNADRYDTYFKMNTINLKLTHYLGDWQLDLGYTGTPVVRNNASAWDNTLTFSIAWKPIPEIATNISSYNDVLTIK